MLALALAGCPVLSERPRDHSPEARIRYYRARLGGPSTYPAWTRLGLALADRARVTGCTPCYLAASRHLERSLAMQRSYEALLGLAGVSLALHRFPESRAWAREAVETNPGDPAARGALFDAELGLGHADEAAKVLDAMPDASFVRIVRRSALREYRGDGAGALEDAERACGLPDAAPPAPRAWCEVRIGALRLGACEAAAARAHYGRALAALPGHIVAREHLAELDAAEGRTAEAAARYRELIATVAEPRYRVELAALCEALGRPREAADERRQARAELLRRAGDDVRDAWHELALLEADAGNGADALSWAEKDWKNRQDVHAADALSWASLVVGDADRAEALAARALAPGGASPTVLLHAAVIRLRAGRGGAARLLFAHALACPAALTPTERRLAERVRAELAAARASRDGPAAGRAASRGQNG